MSRKLLLILFIFSLNLQGFAETQSNLQMPAPSLPPDFKMPLQDIGGKDVYSIAVPEDPMIEYYIREYSSSQGKRTMTGILHRASPYLGFIYNRLIEADMPPELMYLPAIESGFKAWAVSRSGAAGLWQFMMNSISPYDMDVNEWQDDRRDFWKATDSALHKLKYNYERTGSWPLALAAYNCGLGRIERAVAASGTTDYIKLYELGYIPRQTRNYLPKFFAFVSLASRAEQRGLEGAAAAMHSRAAASSDKWDRIELDQAVNLVILASKAGIPISSLHEANAELRHGITPPASWGYKLKVPAAYSDKIKKVLEKTAEPLMRFYIHEVKGGDTFYALSRHFGVSVSMIEMYNPGTNARNLRNGQKIVIPALKEVGPFRTEYKKPDYWTNWRQYTVKAGDSLWGLSRRFNTSVEELELNNGLDAGTPIGIGQIIRVPETSGQSNWKEE